MTKANKGSEWRKWDLHIHTKGTSKNDNFKSNTFNDFCGILFEKAIREEIAAIGITDYFSIENYLKVKKYQDNIDTISGFTNEEKERIKNIFLLPNVELRVLPVTDKGRLVNLHCIFNPDYVSSLEDDFFNSVEMSRGDNVYKMNKNGFIKLGKSQDTSFNNSKAYSKGVENFVIGHENLRDLFKRKPVLRENVIVVVSNSSQDGASAFQMHYDMFEENSSLDEVRKSIYYISDMIFSGNPKDRDYFLGQKKNNSGEIICDEQSVKEKCGSLKACIHGSDAHTEDKLFRPDENKYCWIKADTTFEGLKQIIYEPEQRVRIQSDKPDFKEYKLVIEEVRFISNNDLFTPKPIKFNKNLNVIIGGKSAGKSILLYHIASTLETSDEVSLITNNKYDFRKDDEGFDFEVKSRAGDKQKLFDENDNSIIPNIKYIPQNYLTKLAEPKVNKKGEELLKYVRGLLLEDEKCNDSYQDFLSIVKSNDRKREDIIDNYFTIKDNIKTKEKRLKEKGREEVLEKSIEFNLSKISRLKKSIGLTDEQIMKYNSEKGELEKIEADRIRIFNDYKKFYNFNRDILNSLIELKNTKDLIGKSIETDYLKAFFDQKYNFINDAIEKLATFRETLKVVDDEFVNDNEFKNLMIENNAKKLRLEKILEPLVINQKVKGEISEIEKIISSDRLKLQSINQLKTELNNGRNELNREKGKLFDLYIENAQEYPKIISILTERTKILKEQNLEIHGSQKFNARKFKKSLLEISDGRSFPEREYEIFQQKDDLIDFEDIKHFDEIRTLFNLIVEQNFPLRSKANDKMAVKALLDDYFVDYWETNYDGDKMGEMSTGKASFVVLMLIVGLSNSKAPILIDQPEDNLDNRSITKDLIKYLRDKKTERQIILVTHNPNVVVNADAENIIVANQRGQNDRETESPYKFDYINGSIENTKEFDENEKDLLKSMGIREHIADIVEGGKEAFKKREAKYGFNRV